MQSRISFEAISKVLDTAPEATQGQMDSFFSQLPYKCYLEEVASVGDGLKVFSQLDFRVKCL